MNLLQNVSGISYFNVLRGTSNTLELINFFEEAMEQEDNDGNPVTKDNDVNYCLGQYIMETISSHIYVICLKKGMRI